MKFVILRENYDDDNYCGDIYDSDNLSKYDEHAILELLANPYYNADIVAVVSGVSSKSIGSEMFYKVMAERSRQAVLKLKRSQASKKGWETRKMNKLKRIGEAARKGNLGDV